MNIVNASCLTTIALMVSFGSLQRADAMAAMQKGGSVINITSVSEFDGYLKSGNYVVAYFSSLICGPCKTFHDTYYAMAKEYPDVIFLENCYGTFSGSETLENRYAIRAHPTFVFFDKSGTKKSAFSGTSERTKAKIAGEIVQLKDGTCGKQKITYQDKSQPAKQGVQQQPMMQQQAIPPAPMQASGIARPPAMVQQAPMQPMVQQPNVVQPVAQQQGIQQDVQPVITYHNRSVSAGIEDQAGQLRAGSSGKVMQPRGVRRRFLGHRQRQRMNDAEYQ